jgi:hypothetical protein
VATEPVLCRRGDENNFTTVRDDLEGSKYMILLGRHRNVVQVIGIGHWSRSVLCVVNDRDSCEEFADHESVHVSMAEMYMIAMIYDFAFAKSRRARETFDDCLPYPSRAR